MVSLFLFLFQLQRVAQKLGAKSQGVLATVAAVPGQAVRMAVRPLTVVVKVGALACHQTITIRRTSGLWLPGYQV